MFSAPDRRRRRSSASPAGCSGPTHHLFERLDRLLATDEERNDHVRENDDVAQRHRIAPDQPGRGRGGSGRSFHRPVLVLSCPPSHGRIPDPSSMPISVRSYVPLRRSPKALAPQWRGDEPARFFNAYARIRTQVTRDGPADATGLGDSDRETGGAKDRPFALNECPERQKARQGTKKCRPRRPRPMGTDAQFAPSLLAPVKFSSKPRRWPARCARRRCRAAAPCHRRPPAR